MSKSPCCDKVGLKRGAWTSEEDQKLKAYVEKHGHGNWRDLPEKAGLQRCGKSCRLRWINYLRPDIKRGKFSLQEEQAIFRLHALLGNRWSVMASHLPRRTDNEIKNYWNTHLKKRLIKMGIDPITHRPKTSAPGSTNGHPKNSSTLSHMAQWETTRLEAESRLVRASKLMPNTLDDISAHSSNDASVPPSRPLPPAQCLDILKAWQGVVSGMFLNASNFSENIILKPTIKYDENSTANIEFATSPLTCEGGGNYSYCLEKQNQMHEMTYSEDNSAWFVDSFRSEIEYVPILNMIEGSLETLVREFDY